MHLNIKNDEAHRLASEIAAITGESLTQVVTKALEGRFEQIRIAREKAKPSYEEIRESIRKIQAEYQALPVLDDRPLGQIMNDMYDEYGLPK